MAALSKYINSAEVKPIYRARFAATSTTNYFVDWANQLLEELQERGFLRTTKKEAGQIVKNGIWIPLPSDLVELIKVYDPLDESAEYRVEEVNGQFKILNGFFDIEPTYSTASTFTLPEVDSVVCDVEGQSANSLRGFMLYVTDGNLAGNGILLSGNDASVSIGGVTTTKLYFLQNLVSAFGSDDVKGAEFVDPENYVILRYNSLINQISEIDDEFPIPDDCEERLVPTWLRWCCERETLSTSQETIYWQGEVTRILNSIQAARSQRVNKAQGRQLTGLMRSGCTGKRNVSWNDLYNR